jgi:fructokinase
MGDTPDRTPGAPLLAGVEAGGTKFACAVGTGPDDLRAEARIPTTTPAETLARVAAFLRDAAREHGPVAALGVACFGPADVDPDSPAWGRITSTPKAGWRDTDVLGPLRAALPGLPAAFDTDVNGAALGEGRWGAAVGLRDFVYVTVGTGIGGGAVVDGRPVHGLLHPEMGHVPVARDPARDPFRGGCPFHGDCLEGLASGPAMEARWGRPPRELHGHPEAWALEADYLAAGLASVVMVLSPRRVILGGGVMEATGLLDLVRPRLAARLNGYLRHPALRGDLRDFLVAPALGARSGVLGAMAMAEGALSGAGKLPGRSTR